METGPSRDKPPRPSKQKIEVLTHVPGEGFYRRTLLRLRVSNGHSRLLLWPWITNQQYKATRDFAISTDESIMMYIYARVG